MCVFYLGPLGLPRLVFLNPFLVSTSFFGVRPFPGAVLLRKERRACCAKAEEPSLEKGGLPTSPPKKEWCKGIPTSKTFVYQYYSLYAFIHTYVFYIFDIIYVYIYVCVYLFLDIYEVFGRYKFILLWWCHGARVRHRMVVWYGGVLLWPELRLLNFTADVFAKRLDS